jgi:inorganic triphosphatase YgiF
MTTEVEARFRASDPRPLTSLASVPRLGRAELGPAAASTEVDVYLDTADGALGAARWACRLRTRGDRVTLSLKGPPDPGAGGWLHRRPETEGPATAERDPAAWPPSPARDLLERLTGGVTLVERFVLRQDRVERSVSHGAHRIGTLSLDTVDVEHGGATVGRLHVVELELTAGTEDEAILDPIAGELAAVPGLAPEPRTKLERALALIATG